MSKLDVYLRSIERFGASGAVLTSGQAVTMRFPTGDRHATQVTPHDQVVRLTALAREAGLDGIVCSGQEVKAARKAWPGGFFVVPGVRPANGKAGDQKRVVTPAQAMTDGASILGSGHPLVRALSQAGFHMTPRGLRLRR